MLVSDKHFHNRRTMAAFTLAEMVVAIGIMVMALCGIVLGYVQSGNRAQWSGYSLAAQAAADQFIEQARSGRWDPAMIPPQIQFIDFSACLKNWTTNAGVYTGWTNVTLNLPVTGAGPTYVTNFVTVKYIPNLNNLNIPSVYMLKVDTVWAFRWGNTTRLFTNTCADYFAPDNPLPGFL